MLLNRFSSAGFDRGAPRVVESLWLAANGLLLSSWLPGSGWRVLLLRAFGAKLGHRVVIKPYVQVKFPWRLSVGDHCWVGEHVWIDNLVHVNIGNHVCISQGAYLCTGSHDWSSENFDLIVKPITVASQVWIGAKSMVAPGCQISEGAVLALGSVATGCLEPWMVHSGSPARPIKPRLPVKAKEAADGDDAG